MNTFAQARSQIAGRQVSAPDLRQGQHCDAIGDWHSYMISTNNSSQLQSDLSGSLRIIRALAVEHPERPSTVAE